MQQICYVSKATSEHPQLLSDLREILSEARNFNILNDIHGVLYYADGYFFQCLEGNAEVLNQLIIKLKKDRRHQDVILFNTKNIQETSFDGWSMKFVGRNSCVQQYLLDLGYKRFEPLHFTQAQVDQLLEHLVESKQGEIEAC